MQMKPISLPSGTKDVFDLDIIAGLIVAYAIDWTWKYLAMKVPTTAFLKTSIYEDFHYDDLLVFVTDAILIIATTGRIRKIFIYAFWFNIAFEVYEFYMRYT